MRDLVDALRFDSGPPGFYVLEKPFSLLADRFADGDWLLRALAFLAALLLYAAARTLPPGTARSMLVILFSCSALVNLYAGEARPYALLALLDLCLFLTALRGEERPGRMAAVAIAAALVLYTHYLAIFAVAALILLAAVARRWRSVGALLSGMAVFALWFPVLRSQPAEAIAWMREPTGRSVAGFLSALGGVGRVPAPFGLAPPSALFLAGLATGACLVVLLLASTRANREIRDATAFTLLVLFGVMLAGVWRPVAYAGRTEMAVLPVWIWGVARAADARRVIRWTAGMAAGLGMIATLGFLAAPHRPGAATEVVESLSGVAGPHDVVVAAAGFYLPARLASERGRLAAPVRPLPAELARHPGWFIPALPGTGEERELAGAAQSLDPGARLFLVIPPAYGTRGLASALELRGGRVRELMRAPDALVILWTRDPESAARRDAH